MTSLPPAGWYSNPSGAPGQRYFDGRDWTPYHRATPQQPMSASLQPIPAPLQPAPLQHPPLPIPMQTRVVVTGANHALHAVLTVLTFWACGGWAWIWLIVTLSSRRRVHVVTMPPPPPW